ncbi:hypothetical protein [Lysinibacillus pakistanensis]|uniref:hypothetical protein n=1 Tax=Lysinibacillus pakistanensis TaxID=759811 RepID=UPI003D2B35A7
MEGNMCRIDTLFVTPHFLCLIEIKNNLGNLDFENVKRQCIRITSDEKIESLIYPVDHISASKLYPNIIKATKYRELPIVKVIVIGDPSTIIG